MTSPFENTIYNFTSPQNILRDHLRSSLIAYQTQSMLGRFNGANATFRRPRPRSPPKDSIKLLDTYTHGPPTYPSYLQDTVYALLVEEQYNHFCRKYGIGSRNNTSNKTNDSTNGIKSYRPPSSSSSRIQPRRSDSITNFASRLDANRSSSSTSSSSSSSSNNSNNRSTFINTIQNTSTNTRRNNPQGIHIQDDGSGSSSSSSASPASSTASTTARSVFFEEMDLIDKVTSPESSATDGSHSSCSSPLPFSAAGSSSRYNSYLARLEYQDLRLPTAWCTMERGPSLDLGENDNEIIYKGVIEGDASSVRSNYWVKPQCGLFYYEVKIEASDENSEGHISIGFCDEYSRLDRLPGSDEYSWGYHGENGYLTGGRRPATNSTTRKYGSTYGACFGIGDTIGCGIDFSDRTIFYTRNGIHLGTAFRDVSGKRLYPTIGFKTSGERVTANFGQNASFLFDIHQYRKEVADRVVHHIITATPLPKPTDELDDQQHQQQQQQQQQQPRQKRPRKKASLVDQLVVNYLNHAGYMDTFTAMKKEMADGIDEQDLATCEKVKMRQDICMALRNGHIDQVFIKCEQHYPNMLSGYPRILFRLQCQKFMALVASVMSQQKGSTAAEKTTASLETQQHVGNKRTRSILEMDNVDMDGTEMAVVNDDGDDDGDDDGYDWRDLQIVMDYGQYLQKTYGNSNSMAGTTTRIPSEQSIRQIMECDTKEDQQQQGGRDLIGVKDTLADIDVTSELKATFSILAYIQPSDNPNVYLCGPKWREVIASELNAAMLVTEGEHPESSLERLYRQTSVTMHELVLNGNGQASMVPIVNGLF